MGTATNVATAWERNEDVPVEPVEEEAFDGLGEAERVWLQEDS